MHGQHALIWTKHYKSARETFASHHRHVNRALMLACPHICLPLRIIPSHVVLVTKDKQGYVQKHEAYEIAEGHTNCQAFN